MKQIFSLSILTAAFALALGAQAADAKKYPKQQKKPPILEEVQSETIKPTGEDEAKAQEAAKADGAAAGEENKALPDQLGPRQGFVRDAGRFKVELKAKQKGVDVYLINANQAAPLVEESRVEGQLYVGKKEYELKFHPVPGQNKFYAPWPEKLHAGDEDAKDKEISLVLLPTRERIVGAPVLYKLDKIQQ